MYKKSSENGPENVCQCSAIIHVRRPVSLCVLYGKWCKFMIIINRFFVVID